MIILYEHGFNGDASGTVTLSNNIVAGDKLLVAQRGGFTCSLTTQFIEESVCMTYMHAADIAIQYYGVSNTQTPTKTFTWEGGLIYALYVLRNAGPASWSIAEGPGGTLIDSAYWTGGTDACAGITPVTGYTDITLSGTRSLTLLVSSGWNDNVPNTSCSKVEPAGAVIGRTGYILTPLGFSYTERSIFQVYRVSSGTDSHFNHKAGRIGYLCNSKERKSSASGAALSIGDEYGAAFDNSIIADNVIQNSTLDGISVAETNGISITGNQISSARGNAIHVHNCLSAKIANNRAYFTEKEALLLTQSERCQVVGNYFNGASITWWDETDNLNAGRYPIVHIADQSHSTLLNGNRINLPPYHGPDVLPLTGVLIDEGVQETALVANDLRDALDNGKWEDVLHDLGGLTNCIANLPGGITSITDPTDEVTPVEPTLRRFHIDPTALSWAARYSTDTTTTPKFDIVRREYGLGTSPVARVGSSQNYLRYFNDSEVDQMVQLFVQFRLPNDFVSLALAPRTDLNSDNPTDMLFYSYSMTYASETPSGGYGYLADWWNEYGYGAIGAWMTDPAIVGGTLPPTEGFNIDVGISRSDPRATEGPRLDGHTISYMVENYEYGYGFNQDRLTTFQYNFYAKPGDEFIIGEAYFWYNSAYASPQFWREEIFVKETADPAGVEHKIYLPIYGPLTNGQKSIGMYSPWKCYVTDVWIVANIPPLDNPCVLNLQIDGVDAYTTEANRPTLAIGTTGTHCVLPDRVGIDMGQLLNSIVIEAGGAEYVWLEITVVTTI